jgi:hypothetical protein
VGLSSWLLLSLVPCKRGAHHRSTWVSRSNGIKNSAKVFSFVDSSDSSRVKWDRGHHNRGVAPEGATRAATDRPVRDRKHPFYRCSGRTYLGNRLSPSNGPIDSQNRWRDRLSSSRIHQLLNAPEGKEIPVWLSKLRRFRWKEKSRTA